LTDEGSRDDTINSFQSDSVKLVKKANSTSNIWTFLDYAADKMETPLIISGGPACLFVEHTLFFFVTEHKL